ncbi:MAG: hypothetical protein RLZZ385_1428 [Pseudomonadota bacterium]|jgi:hypothetical protein
MRIQAGLRLLVGMAAALGTALVQAQDCASLRSVEWLLGNWTTVQGELLISENWTRVSDEVFTAEFREMNASSGEIEVTETIRLVARDGAVFYEANVRGNPGPVAFRLTSCSSVNAVFENPQHDSPKRIEYDLRGTALRVLVSDGAADEGLRFNFTRGN